MTNIEEKNAYVNMENVLNKINSVYVSLVESDTKRNTPILKKIIDEIIQKMKNNNVAFKAMFQEISYGGSYYDSLKIGKPEEYDLNLVMVLPKTANVQVIESDTAGYVHLKLTELKGLMKQNESVNYKILESLIDSENNLLITKTLAWMEGILHKVLNGYEKEDKSFVVNQTINDREHKFLVRVVKNGPALTLKVSGFMDGANITMDVDLVLAFTFPDSMWPKGEDYRKNPNPKQKPKFFVVPKAPPLSKDEKYWRLSFQEHEKDILCSGYQKMKPTIRLLKRLRDHQNDTIIASYFIKTIFLWEIENGRKEEWEGTLSSCFMKGLALYEQHLRNRAIPCYWNSKNNLLSGIKEITLTGLANKIKHMIDDINRNLTDPFIVAKYMVPNDEIQYLKEEVQLSKKLSKQPLLSSLTFNADIANYQRLDSGYDSQSVTTPSECQSSDSADASCNTNKQDLDDSNSCQNQNISPTKDSNSPTVDTVNVALNNLNLQQGDILIKNGLQSNVSNHCPSCSKDSVNTAEKLDKIENNMQTVLKMLGVLMEKTASLEKDVSTLTATLNKRADL